MVLWSRTRLLRIGSITNRHYYHHSSISNQQHNGFTKTRILDPNPRPQLYGGFVRFLAAPVLANNPNTPKPKPKDETGWRLNDKIKADFVRLVEDDRHEIVSRREALDRARKLKLDLVEVDRAAKPPVCKIMDYHREKYKKKLALKEKSKSKAEGTLRKETKEIRFTEKTEKRDLQTKADTAKRMMEKGYRVKCMAVGKEDQDLGGMLSRLSALIEDVAVVESGPMVEKKQAYVIVRHMKFGLKKGSGKKNSTTSTSSPATPSSKPIQGSLEIEEDFDEPEPQSESEDDIDPGQTETPFTSSAELQHGDTGEKKTTWSTLNANEDFEKIFGFDENKGAASSSVTRQIVDEKYGIFPMEDVANASLPNSRSEVGYTNSNVPSIAQVNSGRGATNTVPQGPTQVGDNRYGGRSATNTVPQGPAQVGDNRYGNRGATNTVPQGPAHVGDNRYDRRGATNTVPQGPAQVGDNRYGRRDATNTVPQGPAEVGDNRYGGRGATNSVPQGSAQVSDNRYGGRSEVRGKFHPMKSTEGLADVTKLSESTPVHLGQVNRDPAAINRVPSGRTQVVENRYGAQREIRSRSQPTQSDVFPVHAQQVNRGPGATNTPYQGSRTQGDVPPFGNFTRPPTDGPLKREPLHPNATEPQRPSYGMFSALKNHSPSRQSVPTEVTGVRRNISPDSSTKIHSAGNPLNVDAGPKAEDDQRAETGKWGKFGR